MKTPNQNKIADFFEHHAGFMHTNKFVPEILQEPCANLLWVGYGLASGTTLDGHGIDRRLKKNWKAAMDKKIQSYPLDGKTPMMPDDMRGFIVAMDTPVRETWAMDNRLRAFEEMHDAWRALMKDGQSRFDAQRTVIDQILKPS
ncbi:MAG TPA: hypothetical protein VIN59_05500 [Alphaproteobacteria bacterium]